MDIREDEGPSSRRSSQGSAGRSRYSLPSPTAKFSPLPPQPGEEGEDEGEWNLESVTSNIFNYVAISLSWLIIFLTFPFSLFFCLRVIKEYERVVVFRLGRLKENEARGPGLIFIIPCLDSTQKIDLRVLSYDVPPQEILSKDSVTVAVDAVVYFRNFDPIASVKNVDDAIYSTKLLTQTTLRNALGMKTLSEMLSEREEIANFTETILDEATTNWGIKVERVEVKDIRLPKQLTRSMAAEAEAAREASAKFVRAEGEKQASRCLRNAAETVAQNPLAIQLRYLQTLSGIASDNNHTIVCPIPMELIRYLKERARLAGKKSS